MADAGWTVMAALDWTRDYLGRAGDEHPRRSAEWLLEDACGLSRLELYTRFDQPLTLQERAHLRAGVARRAAGEPLQYITARAPFRHLELKVTPAVLIPRPETEVLVDLALEALSGQERRRRIELPPREPSSASGFPSRPLKPTLRSVSETRALSGDPTAGFPRAGSDTSPALPVLDLGTGSGCVALSIASEAGVPVTATDISAEALAVARENAEALGLADLIDLRQGDLFDALDPDERFELIVCNPPYIADADRKTLPPEVRDFEPATALFAGPDGLDVCRRIIKDALCHLTANGVFIMELGQDNSRQAAAEAVKLDVYESIDVLADLTGRDRFLRLRARASD
ncbi:MAG: peptide chain release factor N(5)-glutamine methyltransferase [Actinomycetia bacterium]|nr:peptide chain release factor N(5)-glutamine methyltransferase [Actinomycetes bacterium]